MNNKDQACFKLIELRSQTENHAFYFTSHESVLKEIKAQATASLQERKWNQQCQILSRIHLTLKSKQMPVMKANRTVDHSNE